MTFRRLLPLIAALAALTALIPAANASAAERIVRFDPEQTTRAALDDRLESLGLRTRVLRELPFALAVGEADALGRLDGVAGVKETYANERLRYFLHESVGLIFGGDANRTAAYQAGYDGSGQTIAVIDSGTDSLHPDLDENTIRNVKLLGPAGYVECPGPCNTDTTSGHGTHVSSTAAGDGDASNGFYTGVAPGAKVVGLSTGEAIAVFHALQAFDYLLEHQAELNVVAINNSYGPSGGGRFDANDPIAIASKAAHDAGMAVVFAAGNDGTGEETSPEGSSDCAPNSEGACKMNPYSVAPWTISVGASRKDYDGGPGDQPMALFSSRGDDTPQQSEDGGYTISYQPTLSAPGVNIRAARTVTGVTQFTCGASAEAPSCVPPKPEHEAFYMSSSGTSMAAPHVTGAIAVLQSKAVKVLGRELTPDEVKQTLTSTAAPMTKHDGLWDYPCGSTPLFVECGADVSGTTGQRYAAWQVGAGALDLQAALSSVGGATATSTKKAKRPRG